MGDVMRWGWGNRRDVARAYGTSTSRMKAELLVRAREAGEGEFREAQKVLRDLNAFGGGRHREMERWLGEFDSPQTVLEEWPWLGWWMPQVGLERRGERVVGPEPPGWLRKWGPVVAAWSREREREKKGEGWFKVKWVGGVGRIAQGVVKV